MVPMVVMLMIGAFYWRAKLKRLENPSHDFASAMGLIARSQVPVLALTILAILVLAYAWSMPGLLTGGWDKGVATFSAVMAILEYVNYYHRQLQHFDHSEDFKRLLSGNG